MKPLLPINWLKQPISFLQSIIQQEWDNMQTPKCSVKESSTGPKALDILLVKESEYDSTENSVYFNQSVGYLNCISNIYYC